MVAEAKKAALVLAVIVAVGTVSVEYEGRACQLVPGTTPILAEEKDESQQAIPAELRGFQGMMSGKLLKKDKKSFLFKVEKIMKVWKGNKAENPERAIGQRLSLNLNKVSEHHGGRIMKNYRELKEGDQIELEAFDLGQETLCVKEWLRKAKTKDE